MKTCATKFKIKIREHVLSFKVLTLTKLDFCKI